MKTERLKREVLTRWTIEAPDYRVDFWQEVAQADLTKGVATGYGHESYLVSDADISEVLEWAGKTAAGRPVTIYAAVSPTGEPGLVRLAGTDPTSHRQRP